MQLFYEKLAEYMPLRDDLLHRCIQIDLYGQCGNRELINNLRIGVRRSSQMGKFAYFRVGRVKLNGREAHQKIFFHQNGVQGCSG